MKEQPFCLQPFPSNLPEADVQMTGTVARHQQQVTLHYQLRDDSQRVLIPSPAKLPTRTKGLWETTCFECFLGVKDSPQYWEVNLSPAYHWNVYHFCDYRQGMTEENRIGALPFQVQQQGNTLSLEVSLDLGSLIRGHQVLEIGVSAVIEYNNGEVSYWALTHKAQQADFHQRESFILELAASPESPSS